MVARSVKYESPGHTIVKYPYRTLHIRFKESQKEFDAKKKAKRKAAAKKSAKSRQPRKYDYDPETRTYRTKSGRITDAPLRAMKGYDDYMMATGLAADRYGEISDMRARLIDDHWEQVAGHKRWMTDDKSLIREYKKYQQFHRGRR